MKTVLRRLALFTLGIISLVTFSQAQAGNVTGSTKATATLSKTCTLTANNINFGTLNLSNSPGTMTLANGALNMLCTNGTAYSILMVYATPETHANYMGGKPLTGYMTGAKSGDHVAYAVQSQPINNSLPSWSYVAYNGTGNGAMQTITVYGEVQTNIFDISAFPTPDNYSDSVTANVSF